MTVTKGRHKYTFPAVEHSSDNESLHVGNASGSDAESQHNEPVTTRRFTPRPPKSPRIEEFLILKKASGKKKVKRFQNLCLLKTLAEEDEDDGATVVIMEPYKSPFARLLEDEDVLEYWNMFVNKSEEEQSKIIENFSNHIRPVDAKPVKEKPFSRISAKIRRVFKVRKNISLETVKRFEDDLIAFFKATPYEIYTHFPPTYFERLLLHAIAQYHGLQALGLIENGNKKVEISNTLKEWVPAECFLTDFVAQLRS